MFFKNPAYHVHTNYMLPQGGEINPRLSRRALPVQELFLTLLLALVGPLLPPHRGFQFSEEVIQQEP